MFVLLLTIVSAGAAGAAGESSSDARVRSRVPRPIHTLSSSHSPTRSETLWIFDADFEDLLGDNAGWISEDRSGTLGQENYWHKDTIHRWSQDPEHPLGDSTWWCGTYDPCWRQPRGYGNDWVQVLERSFPEVAAYTDPGDELYLVYDQRYAMENDYDYGYTDVSVDGGETWTTVQLVDNPGFAGTPGISQDWDSTHPMKPGHMVIDMSDYAGLEIDIRFRFESDGAYSSQDQWNNPPSNSCLDGAWQLDNISLYDIDPSSGTPFWLDDCESPGDNGWIHEDIPSSGQTGVSFRRGLYGTDFWTNRPFSCDEGSGWMYAAVDSLTSRMVDHQLSWLISPPISIEGATKLVGQWEAWIDLPRESNDHFDLHLASNDDVDCIQMPSGFVDECPGWWWGEPTWGTWTDDWDAFAGNDWLAILWFVACEEPDPGYEHMGGLFLERQRVGIPPWDNVETTFERDPWSSFNDWFIDQIADALLDSAYVMVKDSDGVQSVLLVASNDGGATWTTYPCHPENYDMIWWITPPPVEQMAAGSEVLYYYEAQDNLGNTAVFPADAPDECFEFSILPITGSVEEPSILVVDKDGGRTPGEDRSWRHDTDYYYREALGILGHEFDVYDVELPGSETAMSDGPAYVGMKYYDTQIWITGSSSGYYLVRPPDETNLTQWLSEAGAGAERNLLLTGDDVANATSSTGFLTTWLAAEFVADGIGVVTTDSVPGLRDFAGGFDFMTYDDRECVLRGGCPELAYFDVIQPYPGATGAELVAEYVKADMTARPAGVAYTDTSGYQTVTLGFGMESMSAGAGVGLPAGHFAAGLHDRVDLMANIMEYFEKAPGGTPTGVGGGELVARLSCAHPNPFGPSTTIRYAAPAGGRVSVRVYDLAGRVVKTLVDGDANPGEHVAVWDGTTDSGGRAASGVYFVRLEADGGRGASAVARKLVLLK
jgi:hypothetical protein